MISIECSMHEYEILDYKYCYCCLITFQSYLCCMIHEYISFSLIDYIMMISK